MRALLTGGTGFIGRRLTPYLADRGHDVIHLNRGDDILTRIDAFVPDVVIHLASLYVRDHDASDVASLLHSNIELGTRVLEAIRQTKPCRFINIGSMWEHWHCVSYNPVNLYAAMKHAFQDILAWYQSIGAVDALTLKLHDTYGPDDRRRKIVSALIDAAESGKAINLSPGLQVLDLIHVDDVCRAIEHVMLLDDHLNSASYALSGERIGLHGLVDLIEQIMQRRIRAVWGARPYWEREVMRPASFGLLPGWQPSIPLRQGLEALARAG